jgi:hypothetical protein
MAAMKNDTCPYAEGTDILKFHYLVMPVEEAKKLDAENLKRRGPVCGKPIHPGSCMCKKHMRYSRGYTAKARVYPDQATDPFFTCQHSPESYDSEERWICHDRNGDFAGEFKTESEAKKAVDDWNSNGGERVKVTWKAPHEDADGSDRGTYIISLIGTRLRITTGDQTESGEIQVRLRSAGQLARWRNTDSIA